MVVEHWDERRDGPLSESALRSRLEARAEAVVSLDATRG
jgi:hypothetical protein